MVSVYWKLKLGKSLNGTEFLYKVVIFSHELLVIQISLSRIGVFKVIFWFSPITSSFSASLTFIDEEVHSGLEYMSAFKDVGLFI